MSNSKLRIFQSPILTCNIYIKNYALGTQKAKGGGGCVLFEMFIACKAFSNSVTILSEFVCVFVQFLVFFSYS